MSNTKEISENLFQAMFNNKNWEELLADQVTFSGPLSPLLEGKEAVVTAKQQFIKNKYRGEIKSIIAEGNTACALTHYQLGHPSKALLDIDSCEIIKVENGKVVSMEVYFDTLKVTSFMKKMQEM